MQYLTLSTTGNRLLNAVNSGPTIELHFASIAGDSNGQNLTSPPYGAVPTSITWDPHAALRERHETADGREGRLSPAVLLAHEFVHAEDFGLSEEQDVTNWESAIARELRDLGFGEEPRQPGPWPLGILGYYDANGHVRVAHANDTT